MFDMNAIKAYCAQNNLTIMSGSVEPGDFYVAMRNNPPALFEAKSVHDRNINTGGWVTPVGTGYAFDSWECVKVRVN